MRARGPDLGFTPRETRALSGLIAKPLVATVPPATKEPLTLVA